MLDQITQTPLAKFEIDAGDVLHGIKSDDVGYKRFGEVYFSFIKFNAVKAWKLHKNMTLNLIVPIGSVRFVFIDPNYLDQFKVIEIGESNYSRITVPPNIWFGFQGISENPSLLLNIANIPHDPYEIERKTLNEIQFKWKKLT